MPMNDPHNPNANSRKSDVADATLEEAHNIIMRDHYRMMLDDSMQERLAVLKDDLTVLESLEVSIGEHDAIIGSICPHLTDAVMLCNEASSMLRAAIEEWQVLSDHLQDRIH